MHVLVCGASTRAAAESAARAGLTVTALDAYADLDQHPSVHAVKVARATAHELARAAHAVAADAVAYLSPFENHPRAVAALAGGRLLLGNPPAVLRRVRDPFLVAATLRKRGVAVPEVAMADGSAMAWVEKRRRSGGGQHVVDWQGGSVPRHSYLQQRIEGQPGSIAFVAAGGTAVPIGWSRQLVGDPHFGASGYRYCGNILTTPPGELLTRASALARAVASEFGLTGVNGIDVIARDEMPYPIEVNPRWSSSMELVERAFGLSVFGAHVAACLDGTLPQFELADQRPHAVGKAIVFAPRSVVIGETRHWLDDPDIRDVPRPGESFTTGQPICTVFAAADDAAGCYDRLVTRAQSVMTILPM